MQKTYWWRIVILILSGFVAATGWFYDTYFCFSNNENCPLDRFRLSFIEPLVIFFLFIFMISLLLFFINDTIFKKWLHFAIAWFSITSVFIAFAPVYSGGYVGLNPTKESISIWMGSLFVVLSFVQIIWNMMKNKNK